MINNTFLSICILTFNRAEKLNKLLINIREQIKDFDNKNKIEILIADNCSTDNTEDIVNNNRIYFNDIKFKYYKQSTNIGADRNTDFLYRNACGKYVWFMADNNILKDGAIPIVYDLLSEYEPSGMLFSHIQREAYTAENPTFNISKPDELFTNYEQVIRAIIKWTKISIYIIKKEPLNEQDDLILNNYLDTGYYFVTLMLYIFLKSEKHSLLIHREPLAMAYNDCLNIRYSPRVFFNKKSAINLPYIINNYSYIIDELPSPSNADVAVLDYLIQGKLGRFPLDTSAKEKEYKWMYSNLKKLLIKKNTRVLTIHLILLNSPLKWTLSSAILRKLYHVSYNVVIKSYHVVQLFFKEVMVKLGAARGKLLHCLPLPVRLSWGGWWLAGNDVTDKHIRLREDFEQGEQSFVLKFLEPRMTILDIGAHHGVYTLLASKKVGPQGQVVSFEPSPRELRRLRWHIVLNRCRNVRVEPFALGSSEGVAELFVCLGQETGCNSLRPPAVSEPTKSVHVLVTALDDYLQKHHIDLVDFIKLDVKGAELGVLKGATKLLSHNSRPVILCELADIRTEPWGYHCVEIYEFLATRGYQWFTITPEGRLRACPKKERFHENLLAVPVEKLGLVAAFVKELR